MIGRYKKKTFPVWAVLWDGRNIEEVYRFANDNTSVPALYVQDGRLSIEYSGHRVSVEAGDWMLADTSGTLYSRSDEDFRQTYEELKP